MKDKNIIQRNDNLEKLFMSSSVRAKIIKSNASCWAIQVHTASNTRLQTEARNH